MGGLPCGVSIRLSQDHMEFCVVLDTLNPSSDRPAKKKESSRWFGFYFAGGLKSLEKCFKKKHHDFESICHHVQANLNQKPSDPYSCPLLVTGEGDQSQQAFWQVSSLDEPSKAIGFIPLLHRSDVFHTIKQYPLISFEAERDPAAVWGSQCQGTRMTLWSSVDRNKTFDEPSRQLDGAYTQLLYTVNAMYPQRFSIDAVNPDLLQGNALQVLERVLQSSDPHRYPNHPYFTNVTFRKKNTTVTASFLSLRPSTTTKKMHLDCLYEVVSPTSLEEASIQQIRHLETKIQEISQTCGKGVGIYNPLLQDDLKLNESQIVFSQAGISSQDTSPSHWESNSPNTFPIPFPKHSQTVPTRSVHHHSGISDEIFSSSCS
eukprot:TRINITY_DN5095_c0_g1_i1.p1 TRINITY_DN5095_c0_g1~~TRINITY_DN5095_c0_g1_i1.p1  ORF type:complete len:402 (-),score=81.00 TRINITY_DN5095_c0_g1_i1:95-1216(-)